MLKKLLCLFAMILIAGVAFAQPDSDNPNDSAVAQNNSLAADVDVQTNDIPVAIDNNFSAVAQDQSTATDANASYNDITLNLDKSINNSGNLQFDLDATKTVDVNVDKEDNDNYGSFNTFTFEKDLHVDKSTNNSWNTDLDVDVDKSVNINDSFKVDVEKNIDASVNNSGNFSMTLNHEDNSSDIDAKLLQVSAQFKSNTAIGANGLGEDCAGGTTLQNRSELSGSLSDFSGIANNAGSAGNFNNSGNMGNIAVGGM